MGGSLVAQWPVVLPALAALVAYSVVWVLPRYLGSFVTLIFLAILASPQMTPRLSEQSDKRKLATLVGFMSLWLLGGCVYHGLYVPAQESDRGVSRHIQWEVACALREMRVRPGDRVA